MRLRERRFYKPAVAGLLILAAVLSATGHMDRIINACGLDAISRSNNQYLDESFNKFLKGFIALSAIKSGLAVLEGSEVGVGFSVQIGDVVQAVYDYVDVAWRTALAAGTILLLIKATLNAVQLIDHWVLCGLLLSILALFLTVWFLPRWTRPRRIVKESFILFSILTLALYLILPLSIAGASYLSRRISRPLVDDAQQGFENLQGEFTPQAVGRRLLPETQEEGSFWSRLDFAAKINNFKNAIFNLTSWLKDVTEKFAIWTVKLIAGYLFDCIIFPLAFVFVVYILTRALLAYVFSIHKAANLRQDLEAVLSKYYPQVTAEPAAPAPSEKT